MEKSQQADRERIRSKRILIVDDDPILGSLLLEAFQEEEVYQARHVLSGELALNTLQTDVPALLLLDYHLPGMNGLELVDWLRSQTKYEHMPILLMGADVPREASCKRHLKTLRKPFELDTLLQLVVELLISGAEEIL